MLNYFIDYLRSKDIIPQALPVPIVLKNESVEKIIQGYAKYLDEDKGLCASTIINNKKTVGDFLYRQFRNNKFFSKKNNTKYNIDLHQKTQEAL